jgi:outer membrane immunogenic protein
MKKLVLIIALLCASNGAFAKSKKARKSTVARSQSVQNKTINMDQQLENLGSNQDIIDKARALQPNNSMKIVQKRAVDRDTRFELGVNYGYVAGGDTYITTQNLGASIDFHINPRWSLGVRYIDSRNALTPEGKRVYDAALAQQQADQTPGVVPAVDFPLQTYLALINFYPIYGKVAWFESGVSQFDLYLLAGGGQVKLESGSSTVYTGGVGMGVWWTNRFSSRIEARYQNYKDRVYTGERSIDSIIMQIGFGIML